MSCPNPLTGREQSLAMSKVTLTQLQDHLDTVELIHDEVAASLTRQAEAGARIDTKAGVLVGYTGAAVSFLATRHGHVQPVLTGLSYAAFAAAACLGVWTFTVRLYDYVPAPRRLFDGYLAQPKVSALAAITASRVKAYESNARKHRQKAWRWQMSLVSLVLGMTLMVFALTSAYW
jgi:hypothetical protein